MQIIQFEENQKEVWNKFIAENSSESFLQAWEWGGFQESVGRRILRVGVVGNNFKGDSKEVSSIKHQASSDNLLAVALLIKCDLPFGQSYLYCPRGPVINKSKVKSQKSKVVDFLFGEIKKIGKKEKEMFLKIDPPVELNQESLCGNPPSPLLQRGSCIPPLLGEARWGILKKFKKSSNEIQPRNTLILDLNKSEEELLKEMKPKTRYNIRLAGKKELRIMNYELRIESQEYFKKKFEKFWELVEETSRRDKFASHNKDYYWKMLENCRERKFSFPTLTAKLYLAEYKNKVIAANIVLSFGDFCVYLHGASSSEHRNVMAPYLLQWRQILDAKKTGCKAYDFWGIEESQKSVKSVKSVKSKVCKVKKVKSDWSGITRFKKGFGGEEKNYVGAYDLVFNREKYYAYKFFRKIKTILKLIKHSA